MPTGLSVQGHILYENVGDVLNARDTQTGKILWHRQLASTTDFYVACNDAGGG